MVGQRSEKPVCKSMATDDVSSTRGAVQGLKVVAHQRKKGKSRLLVLAGARLLAAAGASLTRQLSLQSLLSCTSAAIAPGVDDLIQRQKAAHTTIDSLYRELAAHRARVILASAASAGLHHADQGCSKPAPGIGLGQVHCKKR